MKTDYSLLEAALIGYQHQRELLSVKIADLQRQLGSSGTASSETASGRRGMNADAKKRISLAQQKRWAKYHEAQGTAVKKKRQMSAEGRERIAEATRKRWAEFRAAKAAAAAKSSGKKSPRVKKASAAGEGDQGENA